MFSTMFDKRPILEEHQHILNIGYFRVMCLWYGLDDGEEWVVDFTIYPGVE